jgi:hypothetical protein
MKVYHSDSPAEFMCLMKLLESIGAFKKHFYKYLIMFVPPVSVKSGTMYFPVSNNRCQKKLVWCGDGRPFDFAEYPAFKYNVYNKNTLRFRCARVEKNKFDLTKPIEFKHDACERFDTLKRKIICEVPAV